MGSKLKDFNDYFPDTEEYPQYGYYILPFGVMYEYVANSFLDGFINKVDILKSFVMSRYHAWDENLGEIKVNVRKDVGDGMAWTDVICHNKEEIFKELTTPGAVVHPHLDTAFQDDVLILGKVQVPGGPFCYFYFWYDRDCSDCCIGRFVTDDPEEEVIEAFTRHCLENDCNEYGSSREIPLPYFKTGWIRG
jgi:hypothetical protein